MILLWVAIQAVVLGAIFQADLLSTMVLILIFGLVGLFAAQRGIGLVVYPVGLALASLAVYGIERVFAPTRLSLAVVALCILGGIVLTLWMVRNLSFTRERLVDCELPALLTAFLLVIRWPQVTPLDYLGLLKFEDNAAWLAIASQYLGADSESVVTGLGAAVLRPIMAVVGVIHTGLNGGQLSESYVVTGVTYQTLIFLASAFAGSAISRLLPKSTRRVRVLLAVGGSAIAYVLLGLPLSTGHMTFIGALVFLWAALALPQNAVESDRRLVLLTSFLLLGAAGMWWPLAPAIVVVLLTLVVRATWFTRRVIRLKSLARVYRVTIVIGVFLLGAVFVAAVFAWLPMGIRDFFQVKGGLQPLPQNLLPLGLVGVALLFVWRGSHRTPESWITVVVAAVAYALALAIIAQFVGPDYAMNYSPSKLLLLVAILVGPFMFFIPAYLLRQHSEIMAAGLIGCLMVSQGWLVSSLSLNSPRAVDPPSWGTALLKEIDFDGATVLCLTSVPERRFEAYECTRHATAVTNFDFEGSSAWRHMMLFPGPMNPENEARVTLIRRAIEQELSEDHKIVFLSLDQQFGIPAEDSWWMGTLPHSREETLTP